METGLATSRSSCNAWWALRDSERRRISEMLKCFEEIEASGAVVRACKEAAARRSHLSGFKWKTIYNSYRAWNENGRSWLACTREWAGRKSSLPPEFVNFAVPFLMKGNSGDNKRQRVNELEADVDSQRGNPRLRHTDGMVGGEPSGRAVSEGLR